MTEFELWFQANHPEKFSIKHTMIMNLVIESWKKNGASLAFNEDTLKILFTEEGIPVYLEDDPEAVQIFKAMYETMRDQTGI